MKRVLIAAVFLLAAVSFVSFAAAADGMPEGVKRTEDVVYGRKYGTALTLDVLQPAKPNGKAVIYIVSGGWYSSHDAIHPAAYAPILAHGYTVFAVVHGSQPKFHILEIASDMHRAVRFIRYNAKKWEIDPDHIGITGSSAGGHLTLTMATQGAKGDPNAPDPIDRESSEVQAAVAFFPPTDFLNYGKPGADAVGVGTLKDFHGAFGAIIDSPEERRVIGRAVSPVNFIKPEMPPTLIIHGDADTLVPIQQARWFVEKAEAVKAAVKLIEKAGKGHGWADMAPDIETDAKWMDEHLGVKPPAEK